MPNTNAERDDNRITDGLAWDGTNTKRLLVDPSTARLEIEIAATLGTSPILQAVAAERDDNRVAVALGVTDDSVATPTPLHVDATSGFLAVDIVVE